ncbi:MAG: FMN-binding protein [Ilumatobacteraceae bacterium]|nr:FMN-binding protein [Ilumatobacteraceae bacterium]
MSVVAPPPRRRHPARRARIGAVAASLAATGALSLWFAARDRSLPAPTALASLPAPVATSGTVSGTVDARSVLAYDGTVSDTRFGPVQVQVQVKAGAIIEIAIVQYPDGDGRSQQINARALPLLRGEALQAQGATIDAVSGATYTSHGYVSSLQAAIDTARAAGATTLS